MTLEIEGKEKQTDKVHVLSRSITFDYSGYIDNMALHEMFLYKQNNFSHLRVTSKNTSAAFLLPLGVPAFIPFY